MITPDWRACECLASVLPLRTAKAACAAASPRRGDAASAGCARWGGAACAGGSVTPRVSTAVSCGQAGTPSLPPLRPPAPPPPPAAVTPLRPVARGGAGRGLRGRQRGASRQHCELSGSEGGRKRLRLALSDHPRNKNTERNTKGAWRLRDTQRNIKGAWRLRETSRAWCRRGSLRRRRFEVARSVIRRAAGGRWGGGRSVGLRAAGGGAKG